MMDGGADTSSDSMCRGGESSAPKERSFVTELGWEESEWTALGGGHNGANFNNVPKKS